MRSRSAAVGAVAVWVLVGSLVVAYSVIGPAVLAAFVLAVIAVLITVVGVEVGRLILGDR